MSLFGKRGLDLHTWWHGFKEYAEIIIVCIAGTFFAWLFLRILFPSADKAGVLAIYNLGVTNTVLDDVAGDTATVGDLVWIPLVFWLYVFRKEKQNWHSAAILAVAMITAMAFTQLLKTGFNLPRPFQPLGNPSVPGVTPKYEAPEPINPGFPSGHTTNAFTTAGVLFGRYRQWSIIFYALAVATGVSMVHLGLHFPSDVIGGAFLGTFCATFVLGLSRHRTEMESAT
jgi:undecaprenyl-diphosphatase